MAPMIGRRLALAMLPACFVQATAAHAQGGDPRAPINEFYVALTAGMKAGKSPFQQRFDRLAPVIDRVFDVDTILRTSVGLKWAALGVPAQAAVAAVFRSFTVASYVANFDADGGERFEVLPAMRESGADRIVASILHTGKGEQIKLDYLMRSGPGGWRVVDVLLDGSISRVAVQRSDFRALLASGDAAPLVDSLKRKVAELSGGAMRP